MVGTPRDPIRIVGNENFTTANGVLSGNGTPANPFVIEGWRIYPNWTHGIAIENTDAFVTIAGVVICGGVHATPPHDGIRLLNVSHVRVEDADLPFNRAAISLLNSSHVDLADDETYSGYPDDVGSPPPYGPGIDVVRSEHVRIDDFSMWAEYVRYPVGISLSFARDIAVRDSTLDRVEVGIRLDRSSNVTIESVRVPSSTGDAAISGQGSQNITLRGSILGWGPGIHFANSANVSIQGNRLEDNGGGLWLDHVTEAAVANNVFTGSGSCGALGATYSSEILIIGNTFTTNCEGAGLLHSSDILVDRNFFGTKGLGFYDGDGLDVADSNRLVVSNNTFATEGKGVALTRSTNVRVYYNLFATSAGTPQASDDGYGNQWDDGYPSGGNFWSDYSGTDIRMGPNQDEPGSDGIGDTPYAVGASAQDRYPWFQPSPPNGAVWQIADGGHALQPAPILAPPRHLHIEDPTGVSTKPMTWPRLPFVPRPKD